MPLKHSVQEKQLQNGARGLIIDVPDSTVMAFVVNFRAGSDFVRAPKIQQTAHLMEHMAFGPNQKFDSMEKFSQEFTKNGAYNNATTSATAINYYADFAQFEWQRILELQQLAITKPTFKSQILAAEKGNVHEELAGYVHNNPRTLWHKIGRALGGHQMSDRQAINTINNVTVDDILEHHERTHTLRNMRFVLAGDLSKDTEQALRMLETWDLPAGARLEPIKDNLAAAEPVVIKKADQENINFGFVMAINRKLKTAEQVAMLALNHILTGTLHSRIWGKARAKGFCYGMGSSVFSAQNGWSNWEFYGQIRPENAELLFDLIHRELAALLSGQITEQELNVAKQFLLGNWQMQGQTVASLASHYMSDYFFDDSLEDLEKLVQQIKAINTKQVLDLAQEFMTAGTWTLGQIGAVEQSAVVRHHKTLADLF